MKRILMLLSFVAFAQAENCSMPCSSKDMTPEMKRAKLVADAKAFGLDFAKGLGAGSASQLIVELLTSGMYKGLKHFKKQDSKASFYGKTGICGDQVKGWMASILSIVGIKSVAKQDLNVANVAGAFTGAMLTRATWYFIANKIKSHYEKVDSAS